MAHSIQVFRAKSEIFNDLDLIVFIECSLDITTSSDFLTLKRLLKEWKTALDQYAPGCIDLKLDALLKTSTQLDCFIFLLTAVSNRLQKYGETISLAELKRLKRIRGVRWHIPYKTSFINKCVDKLRELVTR